MIDKRQQMRKAENLGLMALLLMTASAVSHLTFLISTYHFIPMSWGEFGSVAAYSFACGALCAKVFEAKILRRILTADNSATSPQL